VSAPVLLVVLFCKATISVPDVIPESKMKEENKVTRKIEEKKPSTFRGQTNRARGAARVQKTEKEIRNAPPQKVKRNRGIKRR
jgi:hypothetical protein